MLECADPNNLAAVPKTLFTPGSYELSQLLGDIDLGKLALPELQRPFVWKKTAVRDLLDSMYRGYPVGYLMLWDANQVDSRMIGVDGKQHTPTEFIVDGQQRLTSLYAVMKGKEVTFSDFIKDRIRVAFRPADANFAIPDAATDRDPEYLADITKLWTSEPWEVIDGFLERLREARPESLADGGESRLRGALAQLEGLRDYPFQAVRIGRTVDEEQVAEIFMRVNSGGTQLTQADFILTLLSVFRDEDRRKLEAFSRLSRIVPADATPSPYNHLVSPDADQLLRVAVLVAFRRGRLQSVLALLRGAGIETDEALPVSERDAQLDRLGEAIDQVLDLTSWHEYIKTLMAAGYRRSREISSANAVLLVYALYLIGRDYGLSHSALRTSIARFFFMATLTGRYTRGSFETQITQDVQTFTEAKDGEGYLTALRQAIERTLTPDFWSLNLPQSLATSSSRSPELYAYAASLTLLNARVPPFGAAEGSEPKAAIAIRDLFDPVVHPKKAAIERHHLFPRRYLEASGVSGVRQINQIANLAYVEWPENIEISDTAPAEYWRRFKSQFNASDLFNHALPEDWSEMPYPQFLEARREMIAQVVKAGFETIGKTTTEDEPAESREAAVATYLHPDRPFSNDLAIRRVLRQLKGSVLWYEQHMDRKALELLSDDLPLDQIDAIHLLSGPANVSAKTKKSFERFSSELELHGIEVEWRVLPNERSRSFHARVIADDSKAFEVPPLNSVLAGTVDSIRRSEIPLDAFRSAWEESTTTRLGDFQPIS